MQLICSLDNVDFSLKLFPKVEIKKDKQYLIFSDVKLDFNTSRLVYIQFQAGEKTFEIRALYSRFNLISKIDP